MILWLDVATVGLLCFGVSRAYGRGRQGRLQPRRGRGGRRAPRHRRRLAAHVRGAAPRAPPVARRRGGGSARRRAREEERRRPKYERLSVAREPGTDPALVEALTKPEDVERELERFRVWQRADDGACPRCGGLGAYGVCDGAKGDREGHLPCGCEICHLCHGSGTTDAVLDELEPDERATADAVPGESRFKLAADCDHFYCADCIRGSLGAMMDTGQFPAYCPACRADARGDAERLRAGPGRITDATLTFLQRRRAFKDRGEAFFRCPADDCGNWLLAAKPGEIIEIRGDKIVREKKIGLAPCGAAVCLVCKTELPRYAEPMSPGTVDPRVGQSVGARSARAARGSPWRRAVVTARETSGVRVKYLQGGDEDATPRTPGGEHENRHARRYEATKQAMAQIGKQCPVCDQWIQKNDGCDWMTPAARPWPRASRLPGDCIRNGGCGIAFKWGSLEVADDPCG
ncbi:hypothetical protein SO694_00005442 [Aureococcus anophagefferens]|uniref:RING-type domain-containing protein n=1 Tax=Aureococcus anophagefferens TaxID=44056 RepID=A0ABR1GA73_AURAN